MRAGLPLFHKVAGTRILVAGDPGMAAPKRQLVERAGGVVITDPDTAIEQGVRLAFVAEPAEEDARAMAERLKEAGMLVNVVDRPTLCDFTTPSILERDPLAIAIGTGGASAGLAKQLRLALERLLPAGLGELASGLAAIRPRLRELVPDGGERRRLLDQALAPGGALDPLREGAAAGVSDWLASLRGREAAPRDEVQAIQLASFDADDLTLRQARWLGEADCILHHPTIPAAILARSRADAERVVFDGAEPPLVELRSKGLIVILRAPPSGSAGER
jgi:uroporphyrin-III C-methyltransferase/precorrin-2 dehydrogenase/sirohydrochlorin ferrochelatase